jgi:hypothetical protein
MPTTGHTILSTRCPHALHASYDSLGCYQGMISNSQFLSLLHLIFQFELLEGIGAISKAEGKKAAMRSGNYQDNVTTPLAREHDNDATGDDEEDESAADPDTDANVADGVLPAIERVRNVHHCHLPTKQVKHPNQLRKIVKAVRSSPQRRQSWACEIQYVQLEGGRISDDCSSSLMLILDVRTRWSSTHQMLRTLL